jgi:hypothetical protein
MTLEQYDEMFADQDGCCAICEEPETVTFNGVPVRLSVDHNHDTGQIRGLLCRNCNSAVGHIEAKPIRLQAIAAYLAKYEAAHVDSTT